MKPLISIIIPVYDKELFIDECMQSVLQQTYYNLEIIIVDDGSTDNSGIICEKYAKLDKRVSVYHEKNKGAASARNFGIDIAAGEYITFIDCDDKVAINYIKVLYDNISSSNADFAICNVKLIYNKDVKNCYMMNNVRNSRVMNNEDMIGLLLEKNEMFSVGYLLRRICTKDLYFPMVRFAEDKKYLYLLLKRIKKCVYINDFGYFYRIISESVSYSFSVADNMKNLKFGKYIISDVSKYMPMYKDKAILALILDSLNLCFGLPINPFMYKKAKKYVSKILKKYRFYVIKMPFIPIRIKLYCISAIFGIWPIALIHRLLNNKIVYNIKE